MNFKDTPVESTYLDVDSVPVVRLPTGEHVAFHADGAGYPYPNALKAGTEG